MYRVLFKAALTAALICASPIASHLTPQALAQAMKVSSPETSQAFQNIISDQMKAFQSGDGMRAFSHATRSLQAQFQTPQIFMNMVRHGYDPVFAPRDVSFGQTRDTDYGPVQEVYVTDRNGENWLALYSFEQDEAGNWKISACHLTRAPAFTI